MTWDVIVWVKENAIDYVPSIWANEDNTFYKYPLGLSEKKVREIIYEARDIKDKYTWCQVTLKKKNISSLDKAKKLCGKGQYTSNLETESEDDVDRGTRRKKPKRLIEDDDTSDDSFERGKRKENHIEVIESIPLRQSFNFPIINSSCINSHNDDFQSHSAADFNIPGNSGSSPALTSNTSSTAYSTTTDEDKNLLLVKILRLQMEMKYELKHIKQKIENIDTRQMMEDNSTPQAKIFDNLPCSTIEKLNELEERISEDDYFNSLVNLLYHVGGDTVTRSIYCIMKKLVCNEVAICYSGQGRKHKLAFCTLKIFRVVTTAIMKRHKDANEELIKKGVALYLAQSKARERPTASTP